MRLPLALALAATLAACAARVPPRPSGAPSPAPGAVDAFTTATRDCRGLRGLTAELALSGRAGGERIRGRVVAGLESGGAARLEGLAPFGAPIFILAARDETATLLLPRDHRVLASARVADVLERLTGLALGADDLRLVLTACLVDGTPPSEGRAWPGGWQAVSLGEGIVAYLKAVNGRLSVVAADYREWRVDYADYLNGWPRTVRVRRAADPSTDLMARVSQLEINVPIDPRAFRVEVPDGTAPMTLDQLRAVAPLAPPPEAPGS